MVKEKKLRRITIEPAENGHTVTAEHEPDADDKQPFYGGNNQKSVFNNTADVMHHVGKLIGHSAVPKAKSAPVDTTGGMGMAFSQKKK